MKGAADGQGLGNKFLSNIRECDALVHVVRCFEDTDVRMMKVVPFSLSNATFSNTDNPRRRQCRFAARHRSDKF